MVINLTYFLAKIYLFFIIILKSKKKKLALAFLYCLGQETWLHDSWKLIYIKQSKFYNFFHLEKLKDVEHNFEIF